MTQAPIRKYAYKSCVIDSSRWDAFRPRADDIVIATSYKAGTTWMQTIVANLIFRDDAIPDAPTELSPWLDMRPFPIEGVLSKLEAQTHRRFIKTHLPLDALPFYPQVKYIMVGRDPRDVAMSMLNHHNNYTDEARAMFDQFAEREEDLTPPPFADLRDFWRQHITRGTTPWETDGYPYWSQIRYAQTWWDYRHLPNILLVHYNDLLADLAGEIRRVAAFIDIPIDGVEAARIADATTFASMKKRADEIVPGAARAWKGGGQTFINKGVNGRWRDEFEPEDDRLYEAAVSRTLRPECRRWLEKGWRDLDSSAASART